MTTALTLVAVAIVIVPVGYFLYGGFLSGYPGAPTTSFTLEPFKNVYLSSKYLPVVRNSVLIGVGTATVSTLVGAVFAWVVTRTDIPGRKFFAASMLVPIAIAPFVAALAWITLLAPKVGFLNIFWDNLFGSDLTDIYSLGGMMWVMGLSFVPFAYLLVVGSLETVPAEAEEAARVHGAGLVRTLRTVVLPSVATSVLGAWIVVFIIASHAFSVPVLLGTPVGLDTVSSEIYNVVTRGVGGSSIGEANMLATLIMWPALLGLAWHVFYTRRRGELQLIGIRLQGGGVMLGKARWPAFVAVALYLLVSIVLPVASLVLGSLLPFRTPNVSFDILTLTQFERLLENDAFITSVVNTVELALLGAIVGTALSFMVAYSSTRPRSVLGGVAGLLSLASITVPGFVLGLGFVWMFASLDFMRPLGGTIPGMALAMVAAFIGFGVRVCVSSMSQIANRYEEAAMVCGAATGRRLWRILVPLMAPTLVSVFRIFVVLMILELNVVVLLYQPSSITLPILTFTKGTATAAPEVFAAAVMQLIIVGAIFCLMAIVGAAVRRVHGSLRAQPRPIES